MTVQQYNLYPLLFQFIPFISHPFAIHCCEESDFICLWTSCRCWKAAILKANEVHFLFKSCSRSSTIAVALHWTCSSWSMSFIYWEAETQQSILKKCWVMRIKSSIDLLAMIMRAVTLFTEYWRIYCVIWFS